MMVDFNYKMAIVVRKDVKMSVGKMGAQIAHAAVDCAIQCRDTNPAMFNAWDREGHKKVVLGIDNLEELLALRELVVSEGCIHAVVTDMGKTEIAPNTITCMGIGPSVNEKMNRITDKLKLY
jgi:PTH2 family peptidyl-tRNA hydrolase